MIVTYLTPSNQRFFVAFRFASASFVQFVYAQCPLRSTESVWIVPGTIPVN